MHTTAEPSYASTPLPLLCLTLGPLCLLPAWFYTFDLYNHDSCPNMQSVPTPLTLRE